VKLSTPEPHVVTNTTQEPRPAWTSSLRTWFFSWEMYLVIVVAGLLRLYRINTTEFDDDQAAVFRMAHDAVSHGMLVATSNIASIGIYNPPAIIYCFMLPAAFSADPLWGAVMVGVLMTISVLLTYIFVRRYYGRGAATIAALLYAVATRPIFYSRFIWNQNLLPLFTMLFFFALFRGVVERKKGWLAPAIFLLGILVQLHASSVMLIFPLGLTLLLAPKTLRFRDFVFSAIGLLVAYFPYILWEVSTHFIDVNVLLTVTKQPVLVDDKVWTFYELFLSPYDFTQDPVAHSLLGPLVHRLKWVLPTMITLLGAGTLTALFSVFWPQSSAKKSEQTRTKTPLWMSARNYLMEFRATPYRCGLVVLLIWQIAPLLLLIRHSIGLYVHYMIILMPGPFIFIGLLFAKNVVWNGRRDLWLRVGRYGLYAVACLCVIAQLVGSTAGMLDLARGNFSDTALSSPYYSDLNSLQAALRMADQVAQQHHFKRVYVSYDSATQASLRYLSEQMHTPTTVFDSNRCAILPGTGPAVMLVGPYTSFTDALLQHFANAKIVARPKRLSGAPFKLYIVQPIQAQTSDQGRFGNDLQLLDSVVHPFSFNSSHWLVTRWRMLRSAQPADQKLYKYNLTQNHGYNVCSLTSMQAGDQLLFAVKASTKNDQTALTVRINAFEQNPESIKYGPISFATYRSITSAERPLPTKTGGTDTIPIASS